MPVLTPTPTSTPCPILTPTPTEEPTEVPTTSVEPTVPFAISVTPSGPGRTIIPQTSPWDEAGAIDEGPIVSDSVAPSVAAFPSTVTGSPIPPQLHAPPTKTPGRKA